MSVWFITGASRGLGRSLVTAALAAGHQAADRDLLRRAAAALRARGIPVDGLTTQARTRQQLDDTPAAWSLALSVLVGVAAVLVAALVMLVVTATTWRARAADLGALRMTGLSSRRLLRIEMIATLPTVLLGSMAGAACGILAAKLSLPEVRQFTQPPAVPTTDFSVPWSMVAAIGVLAVGLLVGVAVGSSRWVAQRSRLSQLRQIG